MKFPACFSFAKKSIPGAMLSSEPPLASAAEKTPAKAEPDVSGLAVQRDLVLVLGLEQVGPRLRRVVDDGRLTPNEITPQ